MRLHNSFTTLKVVNLMLLPREVLLLGSENREFSSLVHFTALTSLTLRMSSEANTSYNVDGSLGVLSTLRALRVLDIKPLAQEKGISQLTSLTKLSFCARQRASFPPCTCSDIYSNTDQILDCADCNEQSKRHGWPSVLSIPQSHVVQYGAEIGQLPLLQELSVSLGYNHSRHRTTRLQRGQHGPQDPNAVCNRFQIPGDNKLNNLRNLTINGYSHATSCTGNGSSSQWEARLHDPLKEFGTTASAGVPTASARDSKTPTGSNGTNDFINLAYRTHTPEIIALFIQRVPSLINVKLSPSDLIPEEVQPLGSAKTWLKRPLGEALKSRDERGWRYTAVVKGEREINGMHMVVTLEPRELG